MLYFFTWNSEFLVREKTLAWKNQYLNKYWDFNMIHFKDLAEVDDNTLNQELLAEWFMWEKKLILIDDFPLKSSEKNSVFIQKQDLLLQYLQKIPENNIVLFSSVNPDKRAKFYKTLVKLAEVKEFNTSNDSDIINIISRKYNQKISNSAINLLVRYKAWNLEKIISEIEKLLINNNFIDDKLVENIIFPELEESIFLFIDDLLDLKIYSAIEKMNIILDQTVVYAFYNNLLANLRPYVYIEQSKKLKINNISNFLELKNRSFLVNKRFKINPEKLFSLYIWLINLDKKMKSGKMIGSEEEVLKYEIEKEILKSLITIYEDKT